MVLQQMSMLSPFFVMLIIATAAADCPRKCGEVEIPYPFGTTRECSLDETFLITCNDSWNPNQPFFGNIPILNISLEAGELLVSNLVANYCYDARGDISGNNQTFLETGSFTVSNKNSFIVIGCSTVSVIRGIWDGDRYMSGCASFCSSHRYVQNGSCSGVGCCQMAIPGGLKLVTLEVEDSGLLTDGSDWNACGYSFVVDQRKFNFSSSYIPHFPNSAVPMVLDWAVGKEGCETAVNKDGYACVAGNSTCDSAEIMSGYRCKCSKGFYGNPYLPDGCRDVNECDLHESDCTDICTNTIGSYECSCPEGQHGDGRIDGTRCVHRYVDGRFQVVKIVLGVVVAFMVLLVSLSWLYIGFRRWKLIKLKENFFERNGGLILEQQLSIRDESSQTAKLFTADELQKATNNYADDRIIGKGGFGTVYKGTLQNGSTVAIKKSKIVDTTQNRQFINEVIVLSQINHRNAVRLLGCCLEEEIPLLVYEFVSNGTLFDHIHSKTKSGLSIPWKIRLKIASETAGVLSYLHSSASIPIIHRDVKSTNILLDDNYTAKVSDFGASKLVPLDKADLSTIVQGTLGYLDPEYLQTSQLTEKSDVYSFGVVLVELMTGKMPLSFSRSEEERNLAMFFLNAMKNDRLRDILDCSIANEVDGQQLTEVAGLAKRCLRLKGDERPTMKEVATELESLFQMKFDHHPWDLENSSDLNVELLFGES